MTTDRLQYPVNSLVSYHYYRTADLADLADGGIRLIGDSGAFSASSMGAPIKLPEFAAWATQWADSLAWVASLDVIGDPKGSWRNWNTLRDRYELDVVPTLHFGGDPSLMDPYVKAGADFFGLGGMVPLKGQPKRMMRWCLSVFRYARQHHPHVRFHGWGLSHSLLVESLPWYSVDSSGVGAAYRYGKLTLYNPETRRNVTMDMNGRDVFQHSRLLQKYYGVPASGIAVSDSSTARALTRITAIAFQLRERRLRQKFSVSPPTTGQRTPMVGPSMHVVHSALEHMKHLKRPEGAAP